MKLIRNIICFAAFSFVASTTLVFCCGHVFTDTRESRSEGAALSGDGVVSGAVAGVAVGR